MPEGPLGFPRLTNVGPFTEDPEEYYEREVSDLTFTRFEDDIIAEQLGANLDEAKYVRAEFGVKMEYDDEEGIIGQIESEVRDITGQKQVAHMSYWMDTSSGVAKIKSVNVGKEFRKMGIATELKKTELQTMKQEGIDVVMTDVVSEGGYRLSKNTGFMPVTGTHVESEEIVFDDELNRGFMVRYL